MVVTARHTAWRGIRSSRVFSNHSWEAAIDVSVNGVLDRIGDGYAQSGLLLLSQFFNKEGFFWGAGFRVEESMHFEASDELLRTWHEQGLLGPKETR